MPSPAAQRMVVRKLLSLPAPLLRLMAGGGVVYQGGRTLDPRLQYLAAQARGAPSMTTLSPEEARRANDAALAVMTGDPEPGARLSPAAAEPRDAADGLRPLRRRGDRRPRDLPRLLHHPGGDDPRAG